jgi:hypothetical protein
VIAGNDFRCRPISDKIAAYIQTQDHESLKVANTNLLKVAVEAVEKVAPEFKVLILQTGGKG